jgi:hypothetical protein
MGEAVAKGGSVQGCEPSPPFLVCAPQSPPWGLAQLGPMRAQKWGGAHTEKGLGKLMGARELGGGSRFWRGSGKWRGRAPLPGAGEKISKGNYSEL